MLFWISLVAWVFFLLAVVVCVERNWDFLFDASVTFVVLFGIVVAVSVVFIGSNYLHANADVAKYQKRYESLVYQYENNFYDNDNDVGKYELVNQIEYWNSDLAYRKELQRDFWLGIYYPNIYDQFEFIELDKGENNVNR